MAFAAGPRYTITPSGTDEVDPTGYGSMSSGVENSTGLAVKIRKVDINRANSYRCYREIKILRHLIHPNIVELRDVVLSPSPYAFSTVYLVYPMAETSLYNVIRENPSMTLPDNRVKEVSRAIFNGLTYMHAANVMHRNLNPYSILVTRWDAYWDIKISDFGCSRISDTQDSHVVNKSVGVGYYWYRAPETLDAFEYETGKPINDRYTHSVDVWAAGCIVAEIVLGQVLFPGHNAYDQLSKIVRVIGGPDVDEMLRLNVQTQRILCQLATQQQQPLRHLMHMATPDCLDFLSRILVFSRNARMNAIQALDHPFLRLPPRTPDLEPTPPPPPQPKPLDDLDEYILYLEDPPDWQTEIRLLVESFKRIPIQQQV